MRTVNRTAPYSDPGKTAASRRTPWVVTTITYLNGKPVTVVNHRAATPELATAAAAGPTPDLSVVLEPS